MAALEQGGVDAIVTVDNYTINNLKPTFKIGSSDYFFAVSRKRPDLLQELNAAQHKILSISPYYVTSLQRKYFDTSIVREALSDEEMQWLGRHQELKVGYLTDFLPYSGTDGANRQVSGLLAAILPDLQRFMGVTVRAVAYDSTAALNIALNTGEVDVIFPAYGDIWSAENQSYILTSTVASDRMVVVYTGTFQDSIYNRIAVSTKSAIQPFFVSIKYPQATQVLRPDLNACLAAIKAGDADCMLVSSNVFNRYLADLTPSSELHMAVLESTVNYCFAIRRGNVVLYSVFNKAIASIDPAKINNAIVRYSNVETAYSIKKFLEHHALAVWLFLSLLLLFLCVLFVNYRRKTRQNQEQLQTAYQAANKAAQAKSEFLSNMSHDMRTPMNAIINLTGLARQNIDNKDQLTDDLQKIDTANRFLLGLINDILDMSKIESGHMELKPVVYPFSKFYHYVQSVIEPLCRDKQIIFCWEKRNYPVALYVDEVRYNQIFFNILSNAVKYSHPGTTVTLRPENDVVEDAVLHVDFVFEDQGIGMSEEFQQKLFQPFERENSGDARMGTGLGLAITKRIIDEMKGTIAIHSVLGMGTTVRVHLDLPIATEEQLQQAKQNRQVPVDFPGAYDFAGHHVLVVEDHPLNREIILRILEESGLAVDVAGDGQQALDAFEQRSPGFYDVILMDVRMPIMDGLEATRRIRALQRSDAKTVTIIAMTAEAFEENRRETIAAGMNEHLSKPIDSQLLLQTLYRYMK